MMHESHIEIEALDLESNEVVPQFPTLQGQLSAWACCDVIPFGNLSDEVSAGDLHLHQKSPL